MENENVALYKETFFDKIFKPEIITLANGHTVRRRKGLLHPRWGSCSLCTR